MADNTINVRIKDRSDTEANWTSKNPVLLKGERAITDGTSKYKIGDGKNTWSALPYYEAMTSADRSKLNGIASGANKTTVDSSLSSSSTNPVQNKVVNSALAGKSNTNHTHDLSTMINTLSTGGSTPTDEDYFVSQYAGGGTTTTTYHRRPVKALLEYIKGKLAKVAISGSYNDLSNKPTIPSVGNGTITIKQAGAVKGSFTTNQSGATTIELTDNNTNTWRDVIDNLTSTATDKSLSAKQGKWLNENKAAMTTLKGSENLNDITTPGMYSCGGGNSITNKPSNVNAFGLIVTHNATGSFYTQILHSNGGVSYRRNCNNGTWASWTEEKHTDTVYTHPGYTARSNGFYKVSVDGTGHVSGVSYVTKADITNLGIPGSDTNTTYPMYTRTINANYSSQFRSQTKGDTNAGGFIAAIRNDTANVAGSPQHGSGMAWGMSDTHGYLYCNYSSAEAYLGAGNGNALNWKKQIAFTDNIPSVGNGTVTIKQGGTSKGSFTMNQSGNTTIELTDNNTTYTLSSITGTLAVSKGGTGSTTAAGGRSNLGAVGFVCQSTEPRGQNNGDLWFKEE